jgi:site-specific recombinase XerD
MEGRLENQIKTENVIKEKLKSAPDYMRRYYYHINSKTHMTKLRYYNNIERFLKHKFGKFPSIEEIKNIDAYEIQIYMSEINYYGDENVRELKESSQCTIYSSIASFFRFLKANKYIDEDPFVTGLIERPKIQENDVVFLTPDEVKRVEAIIIKGAGNDLSKARQEDWKYRDLLLFRIPVINGLRVTALSEININDIDLEKRRIKVVEKGNISKYVNFDQKTGQYISIWLKKRSELLKGKECDALFISNRKSRMTVRSIEFIIAKYTKECIPNKHITPHKLRSTCGTNTYQATKDIYLVSKVLGHKNTMPTKRYAAVFNEDIVNAVNSVADMY